MKFIDSLDMRSAGHGKIYLKTVDGSGAVTITVNRSGQVDF